MHWLGHHALLVKEHAYELNLFSSAPLYPCLHSSHRSLLKESTEVKDVVMDVPVNITASDGSVSFGRQGYSGDIYILRQQGTLAS